MKRLLKLTGGSFIGRKLYVPDTGVRPATNLVREAVFSTLRSFFKEGMKSLKVLDLFAGTGSLGLEAISRGAGMVTFVDNRTESVRSIKKNLEILEYSARIVKSDVVSFLRHSRRMDYDLVFMDPPYGYYKCNLVVELLTELLRRESRSLSPGAINGEQDDFNKGHSSILVHERSFKEDLPSFRDDLVLLKRKKYG